MPRPKRADEAVGLYHALNRGNARAAVFHKDGDHFRPREVIDAHGGWPDAFAPADESKEES